jgi:hypothetical protein
LVQYHRYIGTVPPVYRYSTAGIFIEAVFLSNTLIFNKKVNGTFGPIAGPEGEGPETE